MLNSFKKKPTRLRTFALYNHDMSNQTETRHYVSRLNQDFLRYAAYDSDDFNGRLIGIGYIISDRLFEALPMEEKRLWHSRAYIKSALWVNPRIPEMVGKPELENLVKTYGQFWCTWQTDRGDKLPLGALAWMMSLQVVKFGEGKIRAELVQKRDDKYNISTYMRLKESRVEIVEPEWINPQADYYWKQHSKGFAIDIEQTEMKKRASLH